MAMELKTAYRNFQPKNTKNSEIITGISNRAQNSIQSTHYWYSAISFEQQVKRTYVTKIFCNDCKYIKIIFVHCSWRNEYRSHPRSYEHYCISGWNKAWKSQSNYVSWVFNSFSWVLSFLLFYASCEILVKMFAILETKPLAECQNGFSIVTLRKEHLRLCENCVLCINFHQGFRSHSLSKEEITFLISVLYWCIMVCEVRVNQKVRFDTVTANFSSLFFNVFVRVEQRA